MSRILNIALEVQSDTVTGAAGGVTLQTRAPQQASFFWPRSMTPGRKQGLGLSREPSRGTWRHATANQQNRCLGTTATQRKPTPTHATVIAVSSGSFLPIPYHCIRGKPRATRQLFILTSSAHFIGSRFNLQICTYCPRFEPSKISGYAIQEPLSKCNCFADPWG